MVEIFPTLTVSLFLLILRGSAMDEKDVHFTEKHVDESWKEHVSKEKEERTDTTGLEPISFSAFVSLFIFRLHPNSAL